MDVMVLNRKTRNAKIRKFILHLMTATNRGKQNSRRINNTLSIK